MRRIIILASFLCLSAGQSARAEPQDEHEKEIRAACRHILSPAMSTAHPDFEKRLFDRCVELQKKVIWTWSSADQYQ